MKFETIKHTDVRGNVLNYLKLSNNGKEHLINVGEKTITAIEELLKQPELPLDNLNYDHPLTHGKKTQLETKIDNKNKK